jgi:peroxiredoxin
MFRLTVGEAAPNVKVKLVDNTVIELESIWEKGPVLISFLRHFGCTFCREWLSELEQHHEDIAGAGMQSVAVAMGETKHAERYCGELAPDVTCVLQEDADPYQTYGLTQGGAKELISLEVLKAGIRAYSKGHRQGKAMGDTRMLPGVFIVDARGKIRYAYYGKHAGDHPPMDELLTVGKRLAKEQV